jgi:DUF4097 and DUF4098 domain-containing protein YvlB
MSTTPPIPPRPTPPPPRNSWQDHEQWKAQQRAAREQWRNQREQWKMQMRTAYGKYGYYGHPWRGSVLGPLVLIGLGVIFLLVSLQRMDGPAVWSWFGQWWSLVLVVAGLILLAEWGFDELMRHRHPEAHPIRRHIGSGVIFLLFLLIAVGLCANGTTNINWDWLRSQLIQNDDSMNHWFGEQHVIDQSQDIALPVGASLNLEDPHGDVTVTGTSNDGQIHLALHKSVYVSGAPDDVFKQMDPQVSSSSSNLDIRLANIDAGVTNVTATVPANTILFLKLNRGDLHISGMNSAVTASDNRGDVAIDGITGAVNVHMQKGDFAAQNIHGPVALNGVFSNVTISEIDSPLSIDGIRLGDVHLQQIRGPIHYHADFTEFEAQRIDGNIELGAGNLTGENILGPMTLTTRAKNADLERVSGDVRIEDSNANIEMTALQPLGSVDIKTANGNIDLTVPEHSGFTVDAETQDGNADTGIVDSRLHSDNSGRTGTLSGTVGGGGPQLLLSTRHGNISLHKGFNFGPLPPLPTAPKPHAMMKKTTPQHAAQ